MKTAAHEGWHVCSIEIPVIGKVNMAFKDNIIRIRKNGYKPIEREIPVWDNTVEEVPLLEFEIDN